MKVDHIPVGDPCITCGASAHRHRIDHQFVGTNNAACDRCGWPLALHRLRERQDTRDRRGRVQAPRGPRDKTYLGLDGEGQGRLRHRYVLLAASDESGERRWHIENHNGLSTNQCLEFVFALPSYARLFTFSFNYDLTKMLQDLDERALFYLFRPELRQRFGKEAFKGPYPVRWNGWYLNLQGTKFSVAKVEPGQRKADVRSRIIWDIWKFYQSKFTKALEDWKVGSKQEVEHIKLMKDKRHLFDQESPEKVRQYCFNECRLMATLARKLDEAHIAAGLKLKNYYGAGSSASAMLVKMNVKDYMKDPGEELRSIIAAAFFGGRFDNSRLGAVPGKVWGYDISSAYPYQAYLLPCLVHGTWVRTTRRQDIDGARLACVHYGLSDITKRQRDEMAWGPFPFRAKDGSICYPATSGGGWVWKAEYLAAESWYPHIEFKEAWCYHTDCDCRPFKDVPSYYLERLRIGKEGPGIVIKLGCNSLYGKAAQSVGRGPFNNWVWAGNITSGTRAQVIEAVKLLSNPWNMLMVATDGVQTTERLTLPKPIDSGTDIEVTAQDTGKTVRKPLGGWEEKPVDKGVFYARPGVYFPMNPTEEELEVVRGRGVGRGVILANWKPIVETWESWVRRYARYDFPSDTWPTVKVANVSRFCGAKSSVSRSKGPDGRWVYTRASGDHLAKEPKPRYGEWITREVCLSFNPMPKRSGLYEDGSRTRLRYTTGHDDLSLESTPYDKAELSAEARELIALNQERIEQPEADYSEYEVDYE